jgi:hypothetical protein
LPTIAGAAATSYAVRMSRGCSTHIVKTFVARNRIA